MKKEELKKLILTASGARKADTVIKNCKVVNVFSGKIIEGDIALCGDQIAGVGEYEGEVEIDAEGRYAVPGFIDSHIHIESSYLSPEELGMLLVPHGGTTIIADPHEIVNVLGIPGLDYMMDPILRDNILGLGEFMNFPGVVNADDATLDKLMVAKDAGKLIDGHSPGITGKALNAYCAARIRADHECDTIQDFEERLDNGMYVMLRQGSACKNLKSLLPAVTPENSRRVIFCSDDRQPKTILEEGHLDNHLRLCVEEGMDPITAIRMATLNAAECFGLDDRGAIAPGYRADIVLLDDLKDFKADKVWVAGELTADQGKYLPEVIKEDITPVMGSVHLKDFSAEKFKMNLKGNRVHTIEIQPGGVVTKKSVDEIQVKDGEFVFDPGQDIVKVAVVERHQLTGNVACGFLKGYGIKEGAVALSVAHDSHNIIVVGVSDEEMAFAVEALKEQSGGVVLVKDGKVIERMPMPIAGLMSDQSAEWVDAKLTALHEKAYEVLGVNDDVEPVMTLCFMSLAVIPELKLTDEGLFDVTKFAFIDVEC